ncbi:class II glutamine amidotransferase [Iodobacter fluviatilis]|uniref:Glutamine amidotransferase n=1 Tax=Iodobacter fluviatilis TaxID=537 RepID=A0A377Q4L8_9NEIS|nr:class II glutamine amidotransferase [Iodobacter fluviatilis]TCU84092.1 glutamine amidotransferase [Iodobacter fluviatilis]STQ89705.1 Predicted glutamine amidotransferase [Iodobacter fluviatilis]
MCQLLGMNCNVPTDIVFSFEGFRRRGGLTDHHSDGWGIAFFEGDGCRMFLDYLPSASSPIADLVRAYPIKSTNVIAHIRKATQGQISLANTHPFRRELWGRYWIFAHNGNLPERPDLSSSRFLPVGNTDSEHAFCWILSELSQRFASCPPLPVLKQALAELAKPLMAVGTFNFLLSDGSALFAHCSTDLHYIVRKAPFALAHLNDTDVSVDFSEVTTQNDRVAVIATQPLTDNETWTKMQPGELLCFVDGMPG